MNLLEVPIMFWPLIELFWVLYFVGGLDFKISKSTWIYYKSKLLQKQAPYIFNHAKPSSIWMADQNYKSISLVLGNV